jgi:hypothetical protein
MANICITLLSIQSEDGFGTDQQVEALRNDIEETVTYDGPTEFASADEHLIECDIATRWNVPTERLQAVATKHHVNIRAVGREDGCGFVQVVCIDDQGAVVQDEAIDYRF